VVWLVDTVFTFPALTFSENLSSMALTLSAGECPNTEALRTIIGLLKNFTMAGSTLTWASSVFSTAFSLSVISWEKETCDTSADAKAKTSSIRLKHDFFTVNSFSFNHTATPKLPTSSELHRTWKLKYVRFTTAGTVEPISHFAHRTTRDRSIRLAYFKHIQSYRTNIVEYLLSPNNNEVLPVKTVVLQLAHLFCGIETTTFYAAGSILVCDVSAAESVFIRQDGIHFKSTLVVIAHSI